MASTRWRVCALTGVLLVACFVRPASAQEAQDNGLVLLLDNDPAGVSNDQNYTGGAAVAFSGARVRNWPVTLDPLLGFVDGVLAVPGVRDAGERRHSFQANFAAFTPEEIEVSEPIENDHPYACLPSVSNTRQRVFGDSDVAYHTTLMVGVLGTGLCEAVQRGLHDVTGSAEPRGWNNQISDGGEPTARWTVTRSSLLHDGRLGDGSTQVTGSVGGALGLTTGVHGGIVARWGRIGSAWHGDPPGHAEYTGIAVPDRGGGVLDRYLEAGAQVRLRAYNVLLQGQFRDSEVTFSRSDLNPVVGEAWLGYRHAFSKRTNIGLRLWVRSVEIEDSVQDTPFWLSVVLRRQP